MERNADTALFLSGKSDFIYACTPILEVVIEIILEIISNFQKKVNKNRKMAYSAIDKAAKSRYT